MIERKIIVVGCDGCLKADGNVCNMFADPSAKHRFCVCPAKMVEIPKSTKDEKKEKRSKKELRTIDGKISGGIHFFWRSVRNNKGKRASRTPGRMKHDNCKATTLERFMAKRSRSYKHPAYGDWLKSYNVKK